MPTPIIRAATDRDLAPITEIYNHYVRETQITFDIEPFTPETRRDWFAQFAESGPHRLLVAELGGTVAGYACSTKVRPKTAYDSSVEVTIYVRNGAEGGGIGRALYTSLFEALTAAEIHRAYALITLPNEASVRIHEAFGFVFMGTMHEVGRKFDQYWDVAWYEKSFGDGS